MRKSNYLFLLALNERSAKLGREILANIKERVDATAAPAFLHSAGVGIFMSSALSSLEIWEKVWPANLSEIERKALRDAIVVELGSDFTGFQQGKPSAWLVKRAAETQAAG